MGHEDDAGQDDAGDLHAEPEGQPSRRRFVDGIAQAGIDVGPRRGRDRTGYPSPTLAVSALAALRAARAVSW